MESKRKSYRPVKTMSISALLNKFRQQTATQAGSDTDTVRKIVSKLDALEPERARYIAAFA